MDQSELKALLFYYTREKYYNQMLNLSKDAISQFKGEPSFHLFHALALMLTNRSEEATHVLELIKSENDIKLSVIIATMYAHKLLGVSNKEFFIKLDSEMKEVRKNAEAIDFYYSAFVLYSVQKLEKALDYLDKTMAMQSTLIEALNLKGWILLELKKRGEKSVPNISDIFEQSLQHNPRNLDGSLGIGETYLHEGQYEQAQGVANKTVVRFNSSELPLVLKLKVYLSVQDWEQVNETLNRILNINPNSLEALKITIVVLLCKDNNYKEAMLCIQKYFAVLKNIEYKNYWLFLNSIQLFSQICDRNYETLYQIYKIIEKVAKNEPENIELITELGFQSLMLGKIKESAKYFKTAYKINNNYVDVLIGLLFVEIETNGSSANAQDQLNYLLELKDTENSPIVLYLRAKMSQKKDEVLDLLNKCSDIHLRPLKNYPYSDNFLQLLKPDFLILIVNEYLKYIHFTVNLNDIKSKVPSSEIIAVENILTILSKACPGMYTPLFYLSKIQYHIIGDVNGALINLESISERDNVSSEVYLLMAQIHVRNQNYDRAAQSLEAGLSIDFKLGENSLYHFINGVVQKQISSTQDAIKSFMTALSLQKHEKSDHLSDKAATYIELIEAHNSIGQVDEALKVLEEATEELQKTPEESRIVLLCAEQAVNQNNIQGALDLLGKVDPSDSYYSQARTRYANILLNYRKDKHAFLECYLSMVESNPCLENYNLLGDAYMIILEPDLAIDAYTKALKENPRDPSINIKLGETLEFAHYFNKAIDFYKEAIELTNNSELKFRLAMLYMDMNEYVKAEHLLINEIESENKGNQEDILSLQTKTKLLNLLSQVQEKSGNIHSAAASLRDAKDNQHRVRKRLAIELPRVPQNEIDLLLDICVKLAEMSINRKDNEAAISYYKEALEIHPQNISILGALAKLYMQMNSLELCQQMCGAILQQDSENELASVLMADIAFYKVDFDMSLYHFTQLLTKQPTNWKALVRLIEIMRRTGTLDDAPEYIDNAERMCDNPSKNGGYLYSKAMYQWYSGNLNSALRNFNLARQHPEWSQEAIYNMIEICLNPEDDLFTDQIMDSDDLEYRDSRSMALNTAERLLKELKQRLDAQGDEVLKYKLLTNFRLLAIKEKTDVEFALEGFINLASQSAYKEHVGIILGLSMSYTFLKQSQRAKNQLKRVIKSNWTFDDAEYLERCWLLLADYYIQSSKYDVASDLLQKVIYHNKTSKKAYEYLGMIAEKEQKYKDAAANYELAFKYGGKTNASIGYKLAYAFMKSKKFADAIDIAQQLISFNSEYQVRIKKDILDKSINNLRV